MCGLDAHRTTGISPTSEGELYKDFLGFAYDVGEMSYPIMMSAQAPAADRDTYRPDFDTFVNGLGVVARGRSRDGVSRRCDSFVACRRWLCRRPWCVAAINE